MSALLTLPFYFVVWLITAWVLMLVWGAIAETIGFWTISYGVALLVTLALWVFIILRRRRTPR